MEHLRKNWPLKLLLLIALGISLSLLTSCATHPPDKPICIELDVDRGWCTNTISGVEYYVDETHPDPVTHQTWWEMRPYMLFVPYTTWVEIKAFIIKICKSSGQCTGTVQSWDRTVNRVEEQFNQKIP